MTKKKKIKTINVSKNNNIVKIHFFNINFSNEFFIKFLYNFVVLLFRAGFIKLELIFFSSAAILIGHFRTADKIARADYIKPK